eukprot:jgi/Chlat1/6142/Chrsp41S05720
MANGKQQDLRLLYFTVLPFAVNSTFDQTRPGRTVPGRALIAVDRARPGLRLLEAVEAPVPDKMDIAYSSNPASRPRMLMCYLCGREYGTKSLPIHQDQCKKAWLTQESQKPPRERRPLPQPPEGLDAMPKEGMDAKATQEFNDKMYEQWEKRTLESCANCGRTFRPEALARHHKSCTPENPAKPAGATM